MDFQSILDDSKTFADDISLEVNGNKVTLGDIRGLTKKQQSALADRMADTERKRKEVLELAEQAANLKATLETQIAEAGKRNVVPDDFDKDPFWTPVREKLNAYSATTKSFEEKFKNLENIANNIAKVWAEDRWQNQFERVKPRLKGDKFKDFTYEKARDYAAEHKLFDKFNLPSVERAVMELTKEDDLQQQLTAAREEGRREGMLKGRMGVQPRPTSASGGVVKPENSSVAKHGLEGLGNDVAADPELMDMLSKLGAVAPEDLIQ